MSQSNLLRKIKKITQLAASQFIRQILLKKSIPEIAQEPNVNYLVEGSRQRIGDEVLLNIQLIEAATDKSIGVKEYNQKLVDVFDLQNEV